MSLTINTPSFVKVDAAPMVGHSPTASKTGAQSPASATNSKHAPLPVRQESARVLHNEVMVNSGALSKLFDMLEQVFKTMREMFSANNVTHAVLPDSDKALLVKADPGKLPVNPEPRDPSVRPDAGKQPVKPDPREQLVKPDTGKLPPQLDPRDQPVKPDVGKLPVGPRPENSTIPRHDLRNVLKPGITVTTDAKAGVHVNVNVGHCHCPDKNVLAEDDRKPQVDLKSISKTDLKNDVKIDRQPDAKTNVNTDLKPKREPELLPPKSSVPDLTSPGPAESQLAQRDSRFSPRPTLRS